MWLVLHDVEPTKRKQRRVLARCSCGKEKEVLFDNIRKGISSSCGCTKLKSGASRACNGKPTPTYVSWQAMRTWCLNPNASDWQAYGGRGISIDPYWDSFTAFLDDMGVRPLGHTLDRKDVNGNYNKTNCRWATHKLQRANQRPHKRSVVCTK